MRNGKLDGRRIRWTCAVVLFAVLTVALPALGQQRGVGRQQGRAGAASKDQMPTSLEDRLAAALANNPDIRASQARLQEAEAELNRIRLEVTQKVVGAHTALETQQNEIDIATLQIRQAEARYVDIREANEKATDAVSKPRLDEARYALEEAQRGIISQRSKFVELQAELRYLLGRFPKGVAQQTGIHRGSLIFWVDNAPASASWPSWPQREDESPMLERIRKPFDQPHHIEAVERPLRDMLLILEDATGVPFVMQPVGLAEADIDPSTETVNVDIEVDSLAMALTVIQDLVPKLRFVVRDYGILVTSERAVKPGDILVHDPSGRQSPFARRKQSKEK